MQNPVTDSDIEAFSEGLDLGDFKTLPARLEMMDEFAKVTICEGKFHQVKRMFEAVGNKVLYLKRVKMKNLQLDESLKTGEVRELTEAELQALKESLK